MIYDITPLVSPKLAVWPGDTPMSREVLWSYRAATLSRCQLYVRPCTSVRTRTAPSHYAKDGATMELRNLDYYVGPCQVIRVKIGRGERIRPEHVTEAITAPRVLFVTGTFPEANQFNEDFAALSPELIDMLASRGVRLVGLDTPSVDLFSSKDLPSHQALDRNDMAVLEGVVLSDVPDGIYELIALPLKLEGFDASPVRAILRSK